MPRSVVEWLVQRAFLDDAEPTAVSHAVRQALDRQGAMVTEHISSRVKFQTRPSAASWSRSGYAGFYQHYGEKEVEVRLAIRARWPSRILWTVAIADLVIAIVTLLLNPTPTTWFFLAVVTGLALLVAAILYLNTLRPIWAEERALMAAIQAELAAQRVSPAIETAEQRALAEAEAALEGEVVKKRVTAERKAAPKPERPPRTLPRFSLRKK